MAEGGFILVASGSCPSPIPNKDKCEAAATALGMSDTTASTTDSTSYPAGCSHGSYLYYNTKLSSTYSCRSSEPCLCAYEPPSPPTPPPAPPSPPAPPANPPGIIKAAGEYYMKDSGKCDGFYVPIAESDECEAAAVDASAVAAREAAVGVPYTHVVHSRLEVRVRVRVRVRVSTSSTHASRSAP